jgi:plasmid stability protein
MAQVLIRDIPSDVLATLKERAKRKNLSLQQELLEIIKKSAANTIEDVVGMIREQRAAYLYKNRKFSDSAKMIREDRSR